MQAGEPFGVDARARLKRLLARPPRAAVPRLGATPRAQDAPAELGFIGHATVLIEMQGQRLLTDPLLRGGVAHLRRHRDHPPAPRGGEVDAVLISHIHQDHLDRASLKLLGAGVRLLVPVGAAALLRRWGYRNVEELAAGESTEVGALRVRATPARHIGFRPPFGPTAACIGFIVEGEQRVYFAGDTDLLPEMSDLGTVDVALLPVWGWGRTLGPGHLDPYRAALALTLIRPRLAVPIHWGTLHPIGQRERMRGPLTQPPIDFAAHAAMLAPEVTVHILAPGEALTLETIAGEENAP